MSGQKGEQGTVVDVRDLEIEFVQGRNVVTAVNGLSLFVRECETLCIVGESGSGKSVTALSLLRLIPTPPGRIAGGKIYFDGRDLMSLREQQMRQIRGNEISMIFQEPMTSLNPVLTCGYQISEVIRRHQGASRNEAWRKAVEMLALVRIPEPARRAREFPHQLSGGMRQRVMIAIALCCNPKLLIADEPTTALDVTVQAQILRLISDLQSRMRTAVVLITHDLGVVAEAADRVIVMYAGAKVEEGSVEHVFSNPLHPYTVGLMRAMPRVGMASHASGRRTDLAEIPGLVPALTSLPDGCAFAPRCPLADEVCTSRKPPYLERETGHWSACWQSERAVDARFSAQV